MSKATIVTSLNEALGALNEDLLDEDWFDRTSHILKNHYFDSEQEGIARMKNEYLDALGVFECNLEDVVDSILDINVWSRPDKIQEIELFDYAEGEISFLVEHEDCGYVISFDKKTRSYSKRKSSVILFTLRYITGVNEDGEKIVDYLRLKSAYPV